MKLLNVLIVGLLLFTSCSKNDNGTYEAPKEPVRKLELLEVPPILAERKITVDEMINGDVGSYRLTDYKIYIKSLGKVTVQTGLGETVKEDAWGSLIVPYKVDYKSKILNGIEYISLKKEADSFTTNEMVDLTSIVEVPLVVSRVDGLYENITLLETHLNGRKVTNYSLVYGAKGSFMIKKIYTDTSVSFVDHSYYKIDETTFEKRTTVIRDQEGVSVDTVFISRYELINEHLISPTDLAISAKVGKFFADNKKFKFDYSYINQTVVYFSTIENGEALFDVFQEAMLFAFEVGGLEQTNHESFVFAEKVTAKEDAANFLMRYMTTFNDAKNLMEMSTEEAMAFANKELAL